MLAFLNPDGHVGSTLGNNDVDTLHWHKVTVSEKLVGTSVGPTLAQRRGQLWHNVSKMLVDTTCWAKN